MGEKDMKSSLFDFLRLSCAPLILLVSLNTIALIALTLSILSQFLCHLNHFYLLNMVKMSGQYLLAGYKRLAFISTLKEKNS